MGTIETLAGKQEEILRVATEVFSKNDYHEVTMDEVAQKANVGKGTLYRYFKDKEDLYLSIIKTGLDALYGYVLRETEKEARVKNKIRTMALCILRFFEKNEPFVTVFLQEEVKFRKVPYAKVNESMEKLQKFLQGLIASADVRGEIKVKESALCSALFVGMLKEIFLQRIVWKKEDVKALSLEQLSDKVCNALLCCDKNEDIRMGDTP